MAYERDPDEIGALWAKQGKKGPYFTGMINGVAVVVFPTQKRSEKSPDWRVLKSKPKEARAAAEPDDDIQF